MVQKSKEKTTSIENLLADLRRDPEYRKAEREVAPYFDLANEVVKRRLQLGLTQKDLAEKAHTYQSRISKIESGEHDIRFSTLISIAEALQCQVVKSIIIPIKATEYIPTKEPFIYQEIKLKVQSISSFEYTRQEAYQTA